MLVDMSKGKKCPFPRVIERATRIDLSVDVQFATPAGAILFIPSDPTKGLMAVSLCMISIKRNVYYA
jgi:hypothetical protein